MPGQWGTHCLALEFYWLKEPHRLKFRKAKPEGMPALPAVTGHGDQSKSVKASQGAFSNHGGREVWLRLYDGFSGALKEGR